MRQQTIFSFLAKHTQRRSETAARASGSEGQALPDLPPSAENSAPNDANCDLNSCCNECEQPPSQACGSLWPSRGRSSAPIWPGRSVLIPPAKRRRRDREPAFAEPPRKAQTHLDLGQADFFHRSCSVCGLVYAVGLESDEKLHAGFHRRHLKGIRLKGSGKGRVVFQDSEAGRILMVLPRDPPALTKQVWEVCRHAEQEIGADPGSFQGDEAKAFLYTDKAQLVVGLALVDGFRPRGPPGAPSFGGAGAASNPPEARGRPPACTIRLVWVAPRARRRGIATRLVDAARCQCLVGYIVPREEVEFPYVTDDGLAFASSYTAARSPGART
uniref:N-acetyltransferase n=1 Tax=Tetraselmis sp. GSL018 TaxID=582737 RepID=A0A061RLN9_9CHLO